MDKITEKMIKKLKFHSRHLSYVRIKLVCFDYNKDIIPIGGYILPIEGEPDRSEKLDNFYAEPLFVIEEHIRVTNFVVDFFNEQESHINTSVGKISFKDRINTPIEKKTVKLENGFFSDKYNYWVENKLEGKRYSSYGNYGHYFDHINWDAYNYLDFNDFIDEKFGYKIQDNEVTSIQIYIPKYSIKFNKIEYNVNVLMVSFDIYDPTILSSLSLKIIGEKENEICFRKEFPIKSEIKINTPINMSKITLNISSRSGETFDKEVLTYVIHDDYSFNESLIFINEKRPKDRRLKEIINRDIIDASLCHQSKAWKPTIVLCGSIIEAVLFYLINRRQDRTIEPAFNRARSQRRIRNRDYPGKDKLEFNDLLEISRELKILPDEIVTMGHSLRHYRNYIHVKREMKNLHVEPNEQIATISMNFLFEVIRLLSEKGRKRTS